MTKRSKQLLSIYLCLGILISLLSFNIVTIQSQAKAKLSVLRNSKGWLDLSYEDKVDTVDAFIQKVAKEQGLKPIKVSCYEWPGSAVAAYNTAPWTNTICVNMSVFLDDADASYAGETVEYHLVKMLAHEVRHSYQAAHMKDDSDYGRACTEGFNNYNEFTGDRSSYYAQFIESDAESFGVNYADNYVKNGKIKLTTYITNDGKIFDPVFYAERYPDVKNALGTDPQTLLNHYNIYGMYENRMANASDIH